MSPDEAARDLYRRVIEGWNAGDADAVLLWAMVGMPSPETSEIMPDRNAVQTLLATHGDEGWSVALFQTTPAELHGRDDLSEALTRELGAAQAEQD